MKKKGVIFLVEDDEDIAKLITDYLEGAGYDVYHFGKGEEVLVFSHRRLPDLFIIDILLPGIDGLELTKELRYREETKEIPIIILTCKGEESDKVLGLELGADDYITKPFSLKELSVRIKAILRRRATEPKEKVLKDGGIILNPKSFVAKLEGKELNLTTTEFKILQLFLEKPGQVISRNNMITTLYGYDKPIIDRTIDVHIRNLRKKLGRQGEKIKTIRGVGYKFSGEI